TSTHVVVHRDQIQRCRIRRGIAVGIILEPVHVARALRDLVRDLSVRTLQLRDEVERLSAAAEITDAVQCEGAPERIAPEEPCKAGPLADAGGAITGYEPRPQCRNAD